MSAQLGIISALSSSSQLCSRFPPLKLLLSQQIQLLDLDPDCKSQVKKPWSCDWQELECSPIFCSQSKVWILGPWNSFPLPDLHEPVSRLTHLLRSFCCNRAVVRNWAFEERVCTEEFVFRSGKFKPSLVCSRVCRSAWKLARSNWPCGRQVRG